MKYTTTALLSICLISPLAAQTITWDNDGGTGDGLWTTGTNWSLNTTPISTDSVDIGISGAGAVTYDTAAGSQSVNLLRVGSANGPGTLNVTGGALTSSSTLNNIIGGVAGTSSVTVSGGSLIMDGGSMFIGSGASSRIGSLTVNGGTFIAGRASSVAVGNSNGVGSILVSGGSLLTRAGIELGRLSGTGTFTVQGSTAAQIGIGSQASLDGFWTQNSGSTLRGLVDGGVGGLTKILVDRVDGSGGDVTFESGSLLDVGFVGGTVAGTFTLMEWEGSVTNNGLAFAPSVDTGVWSFDVDATNKVLTVTAVPEPNSYALVFGILAAVGVISRRNRRS